jgi:hypothetical protein
MPITPLVSEKIISLEPEFYFNQYISFRLVFFLNVKEVVCAKYLATILPLLDTDAEKASATKSVEDFLSGDGPELQTLLEQYDEENDNFMEHVG